MREIEMADGIKSGIYEIVNLANGKRYVGSAVNLANRWRQHRCELAKGRHNPILQNAWAKHGPDVFTFRVIERVSDKGRLIEREQHYLDALKPEYNCAKIAGSNYGIDFGPGFRAKISATNQRLWADPKHREKMSAAHRGKAMPDEQRAKISATLRGRKQTPEHAAKTAANNAARNKSAEHRALLSTFWKGRVLTPEHMAALQAGRAKPRR